MTTPSLSICIPTYNRCSDLRRLLDSIVELGGDSVANGDIEVVISDNASSDNTHAMVNEYVNSIPQIKYALNTSNIGFAANINQAVEFGLGKYCWLMGSDERIVQGSIGAILKLVQTDPDIIVGNPITNGRERFYLRTRGSRRFEMNSAGDYFYFATECSELSAAFAFISTVVVKKSYWKTADCNTFELAHPYTHMLRLLRGICQTPTSILYADRPLVVTGHNVNEYNSSVLPHFELDLLTIKYICDSIFPESENIKSAYAYMFVNQYSRLDILKSRVESTQQRWRDLKVLLNCFGVPPRLVQKRDYDYIILHAYFIIKRIKAVFRQMVGI